MYIDFLVIVLTWAILTAKTLVYAWGWERDIAR